MITTTHHPNEPIFDLIKELKKAGYKLGIISNVGAPLTNFLPKELVNLFDEVTLSYETKAIKPEPEIYTYHLDKSGTQPEQAVFIDDRIITLKVQRRLVCTGFGTKTLNK